MAFPIAIGTGPRYSSSRPYPKFDRSTTQDDQRRENEDDVIMTMGNNDDDSLVATVFIKYHFLPTSDDNVWGENGNGVELDGGGLANRNVPVENSSNDALNKHDGRTNGDRKEITNSNKINPPSHSKTFNVIAELRVQIESSTAPFVSNADAMSSRETKCRVPLGVMKRRGRFTETATCSQHMINSDCTQQISSLEYKPIPSIVFTSSESHLACLVPFPRNFEPVTPTKFPLSNDDHRSLSTSNVVIFSIQSQSFTVQQKTRQQRVLPPLPDYIVEKSVDGDQVETQDQLANRSVQKENAESSQKPTDTAYNTTNPQHDTSKFRQSKRELLVYVPHHPRIVRIPQQSAINESEENPSAETNRFFQRKLSKGSKHIVPPLPPLQSATSICDIPMDHHRGKSLRAASALLIGTACGSLLLVDISLAKVHSILLGNEGENDDLDYNQCSGPIVHVSQCPPSVWKPLDIYGEEQGSKSKGRISLIRRSGSVSIFTTSFVVPSADEQAALTHASSTVSEAEFSQSTNMSNGWVDIHRSKTLELQLEKLDLSKQLGKREQSLSYIRAKWLSPLLLVLLTRSTQLDEDVLLGERDVIVSSDVVLAQVWRVNDEECTEDKTKCSNLALVSELKRPIGDEDFTKESAHVTFRLEHTYSSTMDTNGDCYNSCLQEQLTSFVSNCESSMFISYHRDTDCLTLCSQNVIPVESVPKAPKRHFKVHPCCLIWDWKRSVSGLTIASSTLNSDLCERQTPSFFSRFYINADSRNGLSAVHVYQNNLVNGKGTSEKHTFSLGVLSPASGGTNGDGVNVCEPSALLLTSESVLYPFLDSSSITGDAQLRWEETSIPPNYLSSNGPCRLAAVSGEGQSIAVAASCGVCVLDSSKKRPTQATGSQWKLFRSVNDEQSFRLEHMVWWDCKKISPTKQNREDGPDDVLVAIIQYYGDSNKFYLVAWSRKRLGFGDDQLIVDVSAPQANGHSNSGNNPSHSGIPLNGVKPRSMSLISDPSGCKHRALLMVTYDVPVSGGGDVIRYAIYQLHAHKAQHRKSSVVLSKLFASGTTSLASQSTSGIFLAGGSFAFQLNTRQHDTELNYVPAAVIGAITLPQGLVAICVFASKPAVYQLTTILETDELSVQGGLIVSYWKADSFSDKARSRISWNIAMNDGKVYCWAVPCDDTRIETQLLNPELGFERYALIGELCYLGNSSLWMNGASTNENEVAIGQFNSSFGCNLFAGQRSRTLAVPGMSDESVASLHVSSCIVGPPPFTQMLFVSFLILATKAISRQANASDDEVMRSYFEFFRNYIISTLQRTEDLSGLSGLRVIVFKIIELLSGKSVDESCAKVLAGKYILHEMVRVTREVFDVLTVTTFWLSVGRQLEPHQFSSVFPLPNESVGTSHMRTAEDLFSISCDLGSLSTALSALPLFSCHRTSQKRVVQLVYHCLGEIKRIFEVHSSLSLVSTDEVKCIHQLFWFGLKLEDAIESLESSEESSSVESVISISTETSAESSDSSSSSDSLDDAHSEDFLEDRVDEMHPHRRTPKNSPHRNGILSKVVTKMFPSKNQLNGDADEDAIHSAASTFIISGFDSPVKSYLTTPPPVRRDIARSMRVLEEVSYASSEKDNNSDTLSHSHTSVAGVVSVFINHIIGIHNCDHLHGSTYLKSGWKTASVVAHLLQGDRNTSAITSATSANAQKIVQNSTINATDQYTQGDQDSKSVILKYLQELVIECRSQVQPEGAGVIFNLILLLLLRYDTCEDVQACKTALIIVGIISGHHSGRISELIDMSRPSQLKDIYCELIQSLQTEN